MTTSHRELLLDQDPAQLVGTVLGSHRLLRVLGQGGMGAVYEAEHVTIGRRDAVKVLYPALAQAEYALRFLREAQAVNRVRHPCLVEIHHFDQTPEGLLYIVMELLRGTSVEERLAASPQGLDPRLACHIAHQVAGAMAAVHDVGIVHRDLTPRNIMLLKAAEGSIEQVKVLDFGIAKVPTGLDVPRGSSELTDRKNIVGSREYMAPEQFADLSTVTDRGDVFSLGVILCELIGGKRPFSGYSIRLLTSSPPKLELPSGLSPPLRELLLRMLASTPEKRPSMREVSASLVRELNRRRRILTALAAATVVSLIGLALLFALRRPNGAANVEISGAALRKDAQAILLAAAQDKDAKLRTQAAIAIGQSRHPLLGDALLKLLADENSEVRIEAIAAVVAWQYAPARDALRTLTNNRGADLLGIEGRYALAELGEDDARKELATLEPRLQGRLRLLAEQRLCELGEAVGCGKLAERLADPTLKLPAAIALPAYRALAEAHDGAALRWLQQQVEAPEQPALRSAASGALAKLTTDAASAAAARQSIERSAQEGDFLAAVEAAHLRSRAGQDTLLRWLGDLEKRLESRVLAARALGESASGIERSLRALADVLAQSQSAPGPLTLAAAGAALRLLLGERDLDSFELAMVGGSVTASGLMAWLDDERGLQEGAELEIFRNLSVKERRLLTLLAGRNKISHALGILRASLEDANSDVRIEGLRAISAVLTSLQSAGGTPSASLLRMLTRMESSANPTDQVVAAAVRARLGDGAALGKLERLFAQSSDVRVRELVLELTPPSPQSAILRAGLRDAALSVRFLAARALAEVGSAAGQSIFEELLRRGGGYALSGYGWLKRLGLKPVPLDWIKLLSAEQNLLVRYQALEVIPDLALADAIPVLRFALSDPAVVVRSRVGDIATALYRRSKNPELLNLLRALLSDDDALLRARTLQNLRDLRSEGLTPDLEPKTTPADKPAPVLELWRPRRTQATRQVPPPTLPTLPGKKPAVAPSVPVKTVPVLSPAQPLSRSALAAEGRGDFLQAMKQWEAVLRLPPNQRTPAQESDARLALARVQKELGSFVLFHLVHGKCTPEPSVRWGKAGDNVISEYQLRVFLHKGQHKEVRTLCTQ